MSDIKRTYNTWAMMKQRCQNPKAKDYPLYGGRGISVWDGWEEFDEFLADMGKRPAGKTLDRIDPDGDYEPDNCRWATPKEQAANRRPRTLLSLEGRKFGRLEVVYQSGYNRHGKRMWLCRCNCLRRTRVPTGDLMSGQTKSCGKCKTTDERRIKAADVRF